MGATRAPTRKGLGRPEMAASEVFSAASQAQVRQVVLDCRAPRVEQILRIV